MLLFIRGRVKTSAAIETAYVPRTC